VLFAAEGHSNQAIAVRLKISRPSVIRWRRVFATVGLAGLKQDGRRSRPFRTIGPAARKQITAAGRLGLDSSGRLCSTRSVAAGQSFSHMSVRRIWRQQRIRPPFTRRLDADGDRTFFRTLRDLFGIYAAPPDYALVFVALRPGWIDPARGNRSPGDAGELGPDDIFNAQSFINRVDGPRPLDRSLLQLWNKVCRGVTGTSASAEPRQRERLAKLLNRLIHGPLIYSRDLFSGVTLDGEVQSLLDAPLRGKELIAVNRRLLVLAYPSEFPEYFDLPFKKYQRGQWTAEWLERFKRIEGLVSHPSSHRDRDDSFLKFLESLDAQYSTDNRLHGDLWPLYPAVKVDDDDDSDDAVRNFSRYPALHELHIIASGSLSCRRPKIVDWMASHSHIHLHCQSPHGDWLSGIKRFFRQFRNVHYAPSMFRREEDLFTTLAPPGGIDSQLEAGKMDCLALTGWWFALAFQAGD
jgi:transposase